MSSLRFKKRTGDLAWGQYDYPVTRSQKAALDGIMNLFSTLPKNQRGPSTMFYSQKLLNGDVTIGIYHRSVTVTRHGRVYSNQ